MIEKEKKKVTVYRRSKWRKRFAAQKHLYPSFEQPWIDSEKISETTGLSRDRVSEIIGNTNFGNIDFFIRHEAVISTEG